METYTCLCGTIIACSFGTFQALFHWASPMLSRRFCAGFSDLPVKKIIEWHSRTVSTLHALIVGTFCLYILWFDEAVNIDPVWGEPFTVQLSIAITTGYLFSDLLLILHYWRDIGDRFFIMHHLSAVYAYYYVLTIGVLPYFANFRQLAELSTPFVNQRWFLEAMGYPKKSRLYVVSGVAMAVAFFVVRIAVLPPYYMRMLSTIRSPVFDTLGIGPKISWLAASLCLDVMNLIWMYKIARGCYKVLFVTQRASNKSINGKEN
uniref:Si:dkey-10f21.4 n=1 Tax=Eptatretus burgeri TaxID=7764 RepID=A0A8C4QFP5_EPTBU